MSDELQFEPSKTQPGSTAVALIDRWIIADDGARLVNCLAATL